MLDHRRFNSIVKCLLIACVGIAVSTCAKKTTEPEVVPQPEVVAPEVEEPAPIEEAVLDTAAVEPVVEDTVEVPIAEPPIEEAIIDTVEAEPEPIEVAEAPPEPEPEVVPPVQEAPPPPPEPVEPSIVIMDARSYGEMLESMLPGVIEQKLSDIQVSGTMQLGTTHSGSLRLDERDVIESLAEGMTMPDGTPIKPLPFDLTMQFELTGEDFNIESLSNFNQSLLQAPALWEYGITPTEAGLRGLRLSGTLQLTVDGTRLSPVSLAPLDTNILVQSAGRSGGFWLLIIFIIIALGAVGAYIYYRRQTQPPKPEPKAAKPKVTEPKADESKEAESKAAEPEEAEPKEDSEKGQAESKS